MKIIAIVESKNRCDTSLSVVRIGLAIFLLGHQHDPPGIRDSQRECQPGDAAADDEKIGIDERCLQLLHGLPPRVGGS